MSTEYRWEVFSGMDMAVFADAGQVFMKKRDLALRELETDIGFGLRFNQRNRTFLRLDVGFSHEGFQVWVRFADVFRKGPIHSSSNLGGNLRGVYGCFDGLWWPAALADDQASSKKFYSDDPIWTSPKPVPAVNVNRRKLEDYYDFLENTFFPAGERARRNGQSLPSQGVNTIDEVPDCAWYTNRHASKRMSIAELQAGPGNSSGPASGVWTVVGAKSEGVTPGFRIRDSAGRQYLLKFDPLSNPEMSSAADVLTSKFFHALGYNVPENYVVYFDRARIVAGKEAQLKDARGSRRLIRDTDIDDLLAAVPAGPDGKYRGMASLLIQGRPTGPFQYHGTRGDDPNDLVPHENRRDLRALRTLYAWLGHDNSRAINTLDILADDASRPFVKHYLVDLGAALGSASYRANSPRDGNVYLFGWKSSAAQFFSLGLYAPRRQRAKYPKLVSAGKFEYEVFDPLRWVGDYPSTAFRNENAANRLWAARKIVAFTEDEIRAVVKTGQYSDPVAEEWIARCLIERRRKIVDAFLPGMAGLDGFGIREDRLTWSYAGPGQPPRVGVQWAGFDNRSSRRNVLSGESSARMPLLKEPAEYLVAELSGSPGPSVSVYVGNRAAGPLVVGWERHFERVQTAKK